MSFAPWFAVAATAAFQAGEPYALDDADVRGRGSLAGPIPALRPEDPPPPIRPAEWLVQFGGAEEARRALVSFLLDADAGGLTEAGAAWERVPEPCTARTVAAAFARVSMERAEVRMARLAGAELLLVNGEPFLGDPERRGYGGVPVALRAGENELLVVDAPSGFELELWAPRTRAVIGEWAVEPPEVTREVCSWLFCDVVMPVFNASLARLEDLHVHYGYAVPEEAGLRPRIGEWRCGGRIPPLALEVVGTFFGSSEGLPAVTEARVALYPICVFGRDDLDADRRILRIPLAEPATPRASRVRAPDADGGRLAPSEVFRRARLLVYGTAGSDEEDAFLFARARFDQQRRWYATGYAPELCSDVDVLAEVEVRGAASRRSDLPLSRQTHSVLYGNADTNAAWERLLGKRPGLEARRGRVSLGETAVEGDASFGFAVLPRVGARPEGLCVLALFDTGASAARLGVALDPLALAGEDDFAVTNAELARAALSNWRAHGPLPR